jgi:hypothetical protein
MPQASAELREWIITNYGSLDSGDIEQELERRGFTLGKDWCWRRGRVPDANDWKLINFLVEEWDYGGYDAD